MKKQELIDKINATFSDTALKRIKLEQQQLTLF